MADLVPISLSQGTGRGRYSGEASSRLINCYMESLPQGGKQQFAIYATNGWESWSTLTSASGGVRGMLPLETELLVVAGRQIYSVGSDGVDALVGGIASDGLVTMARNRQASPQAVIVSDGRWYIYQDGELTKGNDADLIAPIYVTQKDGYFIFLSATGVITLSGIDATTIDGLDFANAQSNADGGVALATRGNDVVVFGSRSTEFWINTGNADFPFEPQAYRGFGCYSAGSVSEITALIGDTMVDSVVWAATDEKGAYAGLYMLSGYEAKKVSTYDIDRDVEADPNPKAIRAFAWAENGHVFYTIKGTGFSHTLDTVEGQWHERKSKNKDYWTASTNAVFGGDILFGDDETGTIYKSNRTLYDEAGNDIVMEVHLPLVHAFPYELILNRVRLDAVRGVGLVSTDEHLSDPQVVFDLSRDGGRTFGNQSSRSLGKAAQVNQQMEWWGLGMVPGQGAVLRFRISAAVQRCVMGVAIETEGLAA